MDVIEAIHQRRTIRSYEARSVDRTLIEDIIWDAAQAPPPFRDEVPWSFHVVEGSARIAELEPLVMNYAKAQHKKGEPGFRWVERPGFKIFWDAPVLIVISGPDEDCCRAGQNLMLSAHARGLGTCWIGSPIPWLRTDDAKAELAISPALNPVAALCLGYPETVPAAPPKERPKITWVS